MRWMLFGAITALAVLVLFLIWRMGRLEDRLDDATKPRLRPIAVTAREI
jgi:hypothetical protein